jgi:hypothetical protein
MESSMNRALLQSLTVAWCAAGVVIASEYHVAQRSPAAQDTNSGAADTPFKTVTAAVAGARLKPGDTLYVHEGVYREAVELSAANAYHGQPGAHIRILASPPGAAEIKGSDVVRDWKKHAGHPPGTTTAPAGRPESSGKMYVRENWSPRISVAGSTA